MAKKQPKAKTVDAASIARGLEHLAAGIADAHPEGHLQLVGIQTAGVPLAHRIAALLNAKRADSASVSSLDIGLYRDDAGLRLPKVYGTHMPFDIDGADIVLVDDVLFTGRTIRAALDHLMDYGRPRRVELAVLVDRGHRELPIQADYCGMKITTDKTDHVRAVIGNDAAHDRIEVSA